MKEVTINQCDFCKRTAFSKSAIIRHEKICFYNSLSKSCATCLCNSIEHGISPFICLLGVKSKFINGKNELKTNCPDWVHLDLIDNINLDFTTGMPDQASLVLSIVAHITQSPEKYIAV